MILAMCSYVSHFMVGLEGSSKGYDSIGYVIVDKYKPQQVREGNLSKSCILTIYAYRRFWASEEQSPSPSDSYLAKWTLLPGTRAFSRLVSKVTITFVGRKLLLHTGDQMGLGILSHART
jgi:hypothetical protein